MLKTLDVFTPPTKLNVSWDYSFTDKALKELKKLDAPQSQRIIAYLEERIKGEEDPRRFGKGLKGNLGNYWRYRIQDYRILCEIKDEAFIVLVVKTGHRRDVYD